MEKEICFRQNTRETSSRAENIKIFSFGNSYFPLFASIRKWYKFVSENLSNVECGKTFSRFTYQH